MLIFIKNDDAVKWLFFLCCLEAYVLSFRVGSRNLNVKAVCHSPSHRLFGDGGGVCLLESEMVDLRQCQQFSATSLLLCYGKSASVVPRNLWPCGLVILSSPVRKEFSRQNAEWVPFLLRGIFPLGGRPITFRISCVADGDAVQSPFMASFVMKVSIRGIPDYVNSYVNNPALINSGNF